MTHAARIEALLFDRDGTLIVNVPHNADPELVTLMPTAREAMDVVRRAGIPTAVISNQSVIGRGLATQAQVDATNERVEELLGPLGPFFVCPHAPEEGCRCRKPQPGLIRQAVAHLGVAARNTVLIGDMASDVRAATAAGVRSVLVPTHETALEALAQADVVAGTLLAAVERMLG